MAKIPDNIPPRQIRAKPVEPEKVEQAKVKGTADSGETVAASAAASVAAAQSVAAMRAELLKVMPDEASVDRAMTILINDSKNGKTIDAAAVRGAMLEAMNKETPEKEGSGVISKPSDAVIDVGDPWAFLHLKNKDQKNLQRFMGQMDDVKFQESLSRGLMEQKVIEEKNIARRTPGMGRDTV